MGKKGLQRDREKSYNPRVTIHKQPGLNQLSRALLTPLVLAEAADNGA
jgi:hypothetical protein